MQVRTSWGDAGTMYLRMPIVMAGYGVTRSERCL